MTVAIDPVLAEIEELREQVRAITERIAYLRKLRSRPGVEPVLVYWRYQRKYEEPLEPWEWDDEEPLRAAYKSLEAQSEMGECSPEGVEINGVFCDFDSLREMYDPREKEAVKPSRRYVVENTLEPGRYDVVPEWEYRHLEAMKVLAHAWLLPE